MGFCFRFISQGGTVAGRWPCSHFPVPCFVPSALTSHPILGSMASSTGRGTATISRVIWPAGLSCGLVGESSGTTVPLGRQSPQHPRNCPGDLSPSNVSEQPGEDPRGYAPLKGKGTELSLQSRSSSWPCGWLCSVHLELSCAFVCFRTLHS